MLLRTPSEKLAILESKTIPAKEIPKVAERLRGKFRFTGGRTNANLIDTYLAKVEIGEKGEVSRDQEPIRRIAKIMDKANTELVAQEIATAMKSTGVYEFNLPKDLMKKAKALAKLIVDAGLSFSDFTTEIEAGEIDQAETEELKKSFDVDDEGLYRALLGVANESIDEAEEQFIGGNESKVLNELKPFLDALKSSKYIRNISIDEDGTIRYQDVDDKMILHLIVQDGKTQIVQGEGNESEPNPVDISKFKEWVGVNEAKMVIKKHYKRNGEIVNPAVSVKDSSIIRDKIVKFIGGQPLFRCSMSDIKTYLNSLNEDVEVGRVPSFAWLYHNTHLVKRIKVGKITYYKLTRAGANLFNKIKDVNEVADPKIEETKGNDYGRGDEVSISTKELAKAYRVNMTQADFDELGSMTERERFKEYFGIPADADEDPDYKHDADFNEKSLSMIKEASTDGMTAIAKPHGNIEAHKIFTKLVDHLDNEHAVGIDYNVMADGSLTIQPEIIESDGIIQDMLELMKEADTIDEAGAQTKLVKGDKLTPEQKKEVLAAFIYRNTKENTNSAKKQTGAKPETETSDEEWLASHAFAITKDGKLSKREKNAEPHYLAEAGNEMAYELVVSSDDDTLHTMKSEIKEEGLIPDNIIDIDDCSFGLKIYDETERRWFDTFITDFKERYSANEINVTAFKNDKNIPFTDHASMIGESAEGGESFSMKDLIDIEDAKHRIETCPEDQYVVLIPQYSINAQSKYGEGEDMNNDFDDLEDELGIQLMVTQYDELVADPHGILSESVEEGKKGNIPSWAKGLTYPKESELHITDNGNVEFPMVNEYGEDEKHPVAKAIQDGGEITSVEMGDDWEDDHEMCFNVVVGVGKEKYGVSFWWVGNSFYKSVIKAEEGNKKGIEALKTAILEEAEAE